MNNKTTAKEIIIEACQAANLGDADFIWPHALQSLRAFGCERRKFLPSAVVGCIVEMVAVRIKYGC